MIRRLWPGGLRSRLLIAFVLVTVVGAAAAAWAGAARASGALVAATQQRFTETVAGRTAALAPQLTYPPDQDALDRLRAAVGTDTLVTYQDLRSTDNANTALAADALRSAVRTRNRLVAQRVSADGARWLLVGMPVVITGPDGARTGSGIEVYAMHDLADVERQVDALTRSAVGTAAAALPLSTLLALSAASSVLRPVRRLRDTAQRLAAGDLSARSPPRGADELAELTVAINEMAESVQTSVAAMARMQADARRFVADVSHELRTPLTTLTAVVEVWAAAAQDMAPDARESAQMAVAATQRLVRLVQDLMEVSRFDAGTAHLRVEQTDVAEAVRDCLRARGWLDRVQVLAEHRIRLPVDRRRLDVIVANLVGNALEHGEPPVRVRISDSPEQVWIEVIDHGPGLPEQVLPHVFDRFYKADAARTRTVGSGLGLAIARENARLHGGDLTADDRTGSGARFLLHLPRNRENT
ncbi:HAMP domain-containing histidine kinase [Nocardia terpenica]|uniref:HAMP domain-containing sensor histidine kinase n=1 Tax=Nocardia terpenica TaxID=455432 RepID=UPI002FE00C45